MNAFILLFVSFWTVFANGQLVTLYNRDGSVRPCGNLLSAIQRHGTDEKISPFAETARILLAFAGDSLPHTRFMRDVLVFDRQSGRRVGTLEMIIWQNGEGQVTIKEINAKEEGFGTEAKFAALKYLFQRLNVKKIGARIDRTNTASLRLHQKLGFKESPGNSPELETLNFFLTRETFDQIESQFEQIGPSAFLPRNPPPEK